MTHEEKRAWSSRHKEMIRRWKCQPIWFRHYEYMYLITTLYLICMNNYYLLVKKIKLVWWFMNFRGKGRMIVSIFSVDSYRVRSCFLNQNPKSEKQSLPGP